MPHSYFLTVVVPAYNVEKYLSRCLDSLLHQTQMAHKVIIINDGSIDATPSIAKRYADQYPDLFDFISQENHGLGAARNVGIRNAKTDYVTFLDSDDWVPPRFVEIISERLGRETSPVDILFDLPVNYNMATGGFEEWSDTALLKELFHDPYRVASPRQDPRLYALEPSVCRCVFYTDFLRSHNFSFPEGTKWEDVLPHFQLFHWATRCIATTDTGFCYRINSGNQITSTSSEDRLQVFSVFGNTLAYAIDNDWSDIEISYIMRSLCIFVDWSLNCASLKVRKPYVESLHKFYKEIPGSFFKKYYRDLSIPRRERLFVSLAKMPLLYKVIKNEHYYRVLRGVAKRAKRIVKKH